MGRRRDGRRLVVQFLYQHDCAKNKEAVDESMRLFEELTGPERNAWQFAQPLLRGTLEKIEELDERIRRYSQNWELSRMAMVDRNVLRLALYELFFCEEIPPVVSINEAIDLAKQLGAEESGKFVNGVLDRAKQDLKRPLREGVKRKE